MNKFKKFMKSKKGTLVLAGAAVILLLGSGVGSARAALTYYSENYSAQVEMYDIGVTLVEASGSDAENLKSTDISSRDYIGKDDAWEESQGELLNNLLEQSDDKLVLGKTYNEQLFAKNSGNIDEYVRMRVYRYWTDEDGDKSARTTELEPSQIELGLADAGWILDEANSTEERLVFYWPHILAVGETTDAPTINTLTLDGNLKNKVDVTSEEVNGENGTYTKTTTTYRYKNMKFNLEAEVDAVQTHNAVDAIKSAWGVDVNVDEASGDISLK